MDTCSHAHRRSRIQVDRLKKLCDFVAANPGVHKREIYAFHYGTTERKTERVNSLASMIQTLCHEHRVRHIDHHYYTYEPQND